jgi:sensor histidine kinase YesM
MAEKEFFNHDGVIITSSRAVFRDTMYPISGISAVKQSQTVKSILQEKGYRLLTIGILMVVFGIIFGPSFNPSLVITYTYFMITISCILSAFLFMLLLVRKTGETSQITPKIFHQQPSIYF